MTQGRQVPALAEYAAPAASGAGISDTAAASTFSQQPATFQDRGLTAPFTTPLLCGTRVRKPPHGPLDFVVANPSGAPGFYIMPWQSICTLCLPTLHDRLLKDSLNALPSLTPASIRQAARRLALQGLAGEEAKAAQQAALVAEPNDRLVTKYWLMMKLTEQVAPVLDAQIAARSAGKTGDQPAGEQPTQDQRARRVLDWLSPRLGQPIQWIADSLEALAALMHEVGAGPACSTARIPRLIALLQQTSGDIKAWSASQRSDVQREAGRLICTLADMTVSMLEAAARGAQALADDMAGLLRAWSSKRASIMEQVELCGWLLDGWQQICLIWADAAGSEPERRAAAAEIVGLAPVYPKSVGRWSPEVADAYDTLRQRREIFLAEDWRTRTSVFNLIARNEHFRALAI